jgi:hypothetical protein
MIAADHLITNMLLLGLCLAGLLASALLEGQLSELITTIGAPEHRVERLEAARHQPTGQGEAISWTR